MDTFCEKLHVRLKKSPYILRVLITHAIYSPNLSLCLCSDSSHMKDKSNEIQLDYNDSAKTKSSPNLICISLYNHFFDSLNSVSSKFDFWLEFEMIDLQPLLILPPRTVCSTPSDCTKKIKSNFACFQVIDSFLSQNSFLLGSKFSVIDVIIWSCLYFILHQRGESFIGKIFQEFKHFYQWYDKVSLLPEVVKGLNAMLSKDILMNLEKMKINHSDSADLTQKRFNEKVIDLFQNSFFQELPKLTHPILPVDGSENILITSSLPYVNNVPHLGNIIGCVLSADVFARYCRVTGRRTLFICGTDEYGTATELKAIQENLTPQQICDKYHAIHSSVYDWFDISFDHFGRTTTSKQTEICQDIFLKLKSNGYITDGVMEQYFCEKCNRHLADRYIEGTCPICLYESCRGDQCDKCGRLVNSTELKHPYCKICSNTPFITKLEDKLNSWFERKVNESSESLWSNSALVITKSWLKNGLKPRCITRDLKWGTAVPFPGYENKVFYVWFDAPIGYLSITASYTDSWEKWWKNPENVKLYQFMAKDNVPFHSVIFPCSLLGTHEKYTILDHLSATEFLNYENSKFSKSRGVGVFGQDAKETGIPSDIWRFYLLSIRPENQDSAFSWSDFQSKNNGDLINNLGNFVNRAISFLFKNFDATVQCIHLSNADVAFVELVNMEVDAYHSNLRRIKLREALACVLNLSRHGNSFMQENKPWASIKAGNGDRAGSVISLAVNLVCLVAWTLHPFLPNTSDEIFNQLNFDSKDKVFPRHFFKMLKSKHIINEPKPLFKKLETDMIDAFRQQFSNRSEDVSEDPSHKKSNEAVSKIKEDIARQGSLVRKLKAEKEDKEIIKREVEKLLCLKQLIKS